MEGKQKQLRELPEHSSDSTYGYFELYKAHVTPELREEAKGLEGNVRNEFLARRLASGATDAYRFDNGNKNGEQIITFYMLIPPE